MRSSVKQAVSTVLFLALLRQHEHERRWVVHRQLPLFERNASDDASRVTPFVLRSTAIAGQFVQRTGVMNHARRFEWASTNDKRVRSHTRLNKGRMRRQTFHRFVVSEEVENASVRQHTTNVVPTAQQQNQDQREAQHKAHFIRLPEVPTVDLREESGVNALHPRTPLTRLTLIVRPVHSRRPNVLSHQPSTTTQEADSKHHLPMGQTAKLGSAGGDGSFEISAHIICSHQHTEG